MKGIMEAIFPFASRRDVQCTSMTRSRTTFHLAWRFAGMQCRVTRNLLSVPHFFVYFRNNSINPLSIFAIVCGR